MAGAKGYKDLIVWQRAVKFVVDVYKATNNFPRDEMYGITSQIRRAAVSIPSNIAEGQARNSPRAFASHLNISLGSAAELETQLIVSNEIGHLPKSELERLTAELIEIIKMLNGLLNTQKQKISTEDKE
jgi:four helix bundle protein